MAASPPTHQTGNKRQFVADHESVGLRLDRWLVTQNNDLSRSRIQQLITAGHVSVDARPSVDAALLLKHGQSIELTIPAPVETKIMAQAIDLDVIYEDAHLIVVNKPAGLVVHPAAGNPDKTLVNALLAHCGDSLRGIGGELRPGIVHRLDKDTSGLLVAAKTQTTHAGLAEQFSVHSIARAYDALVWGVPVPRKGVISGQMGRSTTDRKKMAVRKIGGKYAETSYETLEAFGLACAWVRCMLKTGRTHQIRVHMTSRGHPLIGDQTYGSIPSKLAKTFDKETLNIVRAFSRQALHARVLGFTHPATGKALRFEQDPPKDFQDLAATLRAATQGPKKPKPRKR
jgi:23S rRNA pseudouridine1911/1915/1917 synthase